MPSRQDAPSQDLVEKRILNRLGAKTRLLTRASAALLAGAFAWLKLEGVPFPAITTEPAATVVLRLALVLYYFGWLLAVMVDTRDEEDVLLKAPNSGRLSPLALAIIVSISLGFGVLCWVRDYRDFVVALGAFWGLNIVAWQYLLRRVVRPAIRSTLDALSETGTLFDNEKVRSLEHFLCGSWQWWRFAVGGLSLGVLASLAFSRLAQLVAAQLGFLSASGAMACAILIHILAFESWMWWKRMQRWVEIRLLERLAQQPG